MKKLIFFVLLIFKSQTHIYSDISYDLDCGLYFEGCSDEKQVTQITKTVDIILTDTAKIAKMAEIAKIRNKIKKKKNAI